MHQIQEGDLVRFLHVSSLQEFANPMSDRASTPEKILGEEIARIQIALDRLGIGFSLSYGRWKQTSTEVSKPPYLSCRYDAGDMRNINIVAYYYPLLDDWNLLNRDADGYRRRIESAMLEEMIHAVQIMTVRQKYDQSPWVRLHSKSAETFYERILDNIIGELSSTEETRLAILTAAQLYYEDWTITSMQKLRETDRKLHGREGYLASELVRQVAQIRFGEPTSEEAKGHAWDRHRVFNVERFGTTETLLRSMAANLRRAVPRLIQLSPTLAVELAQIERTILHVDQSRMLRLTRSLHQKPCVYATCTMSSPLGRT
ncbi:MAG TPA: hypothetical protein VE860_21170 [Chthoniobacterales bacterium]|jgi:hypothetical protein|nr:hypothetical protein [Chthoniobacterales bacterium]